MHLLRSVWKAPAWGYSLTIWNESAVWIKIDTGNNGAQADERAARNKPLLLPGNTISAAALLTMALLLGITINYSNKSYPAMHAELGAE